MVVSSELLMFFTQGYFCVCVLAYNAWLITDSVVAHASMSVFSHHRDGFSCLYLEFSTRVPVKIYWTQKFRLYVSLPLLTPFRKMKMVDIVAQKMPSESDVHMARSFLTKILRSSMRYGINVSTRNPTSFPVPPSLFIMIYNHIPSMALWYHPSEVQISIQ